MSNLYVKRFFSYVGNAPVTVLVIFPCSYGAVHVFSSSGESVCQIPGKSTPADSSGGSPTHAINSLAFISPWKGDEERYVSSGLVIVSLVPQALVWGRRERA